MFDRDCLVSDISTVMSDSHCYSRLHNFAKKLKPMFHDYFDMTEVHQKCQKLMYRKDSHYLREKCQMDFKKHQDTNTNPDPNKYTYNMILTTIDEGGACQVSYYHKI